VLCFALNFSANKLSVINSDYNTLLHSFSFIIDEHQKIMIS